MSRYIRNHVDEVLLTNSTNYSDNVVPIADMPMNHVSHVWMYMDAQVFRHAPDPHFPAVGGAGDDVSSNPAHPDRHRVVTIQSRFALTAPLEIVIEQVDPFAIAASVEIDGATQTAASLVSVLRGFFTSQ